MTSWPAALASLDAATARCSPSTRAALDAAAVRLRAAGAEADAAAAAVASALTDAGADASALAAVEAVTGGPFAALPRPLGAVGLGAQRPSPQRLDAGASVLAIPPPVTVEAAGLGAVGLGALLRAAGLRARARGGPGVAHRAPRSRSRDVRRRGVGGDPPSHPGGRAH